MSNPLPYTVDELPDVIANLRHGSTELLWLRLSATLVGHQRLLAGEATADPLRALVREWQEARDWWRNALKTDKGVNMAWNRFHAAEKALMNFDLSAPPLGDGEREGDA